jgi:hypothetical protein
MYKFESEMNTSKMNKLEIVTESEAKFNWSGQNKAHCAGAAICAELEIGERV